MGFEVINTDKAPAPVGPYSQATMAGPYLYCSGQVAINPATNEVIRGSVEEQTKLVMENLKAVLSEAGMDYSHVVKMGIFIKDMNDFGKINEVYASYLSEPYPARACVEVARLPKDVLVEIEAIAYKG